MCEAFASSVATNIVSELGKLLFGPIGRQFGYVLCYKSNVKDLKDEVKKLQATRERVQNSVDEAVNNGKTIIEEVKNWLDNVENKAKEEEDLFKKGGSAKDACLGGWLPNPVVRHPIGRKVKKMIPVIQGLLDESKTDIFKKVYYENLPMGIVTRTPATARSTNNNEDVLESRAKIMEEVVEALADDKVSVIGVYGPPGVGKSKLLKDVETRVREGNLFNVVARVDVKCNPDLERVHNEIRDALGLHLITETTFKGRVNRLREKLERDSKEKNILIILDDLWEKLELEDIGIPCADGNKVKGCKLLLTSRRLDVLRFHMSSADREFKLNLLELGEARKLFENTVGGNYLKFEDMVGGVVENCGGLPLVIHSVGTRLRHGDSVDWRNAMNDKGGSDVKSIVQNIYNGLPDERIKLLFSICVLTSGRIWITDLVAYYMGRVLNEKRSTTIEEARDKLILDLRSLRDYSLLTESDDMEQFGMHDLFVEVGVSIASTKWDTLVGRKDRGFRDWSNDELRKCTAISFYYVGIDDLPEKLDCPKLRMLLLLESNSSLKIPDSFFVSMEKLQVLHLAGLSCTTLPLSIGSLENLNSLILQCYNLEDVTVLGKLKKLQFLRLAGYEIARLPREIGEIEELRILDLRGCYKLKTIEAGMLERLANIEELYLGEFCQWEAEDKAPRSNASLAELKSMKRLRTLHITIPGSTNLSSGLPFGNLNEHRIQIGGTGWWWEEYKASRILKLELKNDNLPHQEWMQQCLGRTQVLRLEGLRDGGDSIHDLCTKGFEELKHLIVQDNHLFQYVVDSTQPAFTRLESLVLKKLSNLKTICRDCLAPESLSELKTVIVENCGATKHLFPPSAMRRFMQLEEITIRGCCLMGQIIGDDKTVECGDEIEDDPPVSCKLRRLTLEDLPEMTSFKEVSLPSLESLTLSKLPKLKYIWNSQLPSDVSKLKFLEVKGCAFILSIIPSNLLIVLQNLEAVTIENCQLIREVFNFERPTISEDVTVLSRLTTLTLSDLPRLEHIWSKDQRLCLQNLRALKVQNCESLRLIFSSSMAKTLQQIKEIKIVNCKLLEEIIDLQEEESEEAASIDTIEFPLLTSLYLEELPNFRTFSFGTYHMHCPTLTRLRISRCPKMMTFSSFERKQQWKTADTGLQRALGGTNSICSLPILFNNNVLFPSLEKLTLMSLPGLTKIWHDELPEESFCKLTSIKVHDCENLSHIFPSTFIGRLQSLEKIKVVNCSSLDALMEHIAVNSKKRQDRLLGLKKLKLWDLPRLNALALIGTESTLSLPSLTDVSLHRCQSLRYLVTNDSSRPLDNLEMLDISGFNNMEEVVVMQERVEGNLKAVKFLHLRTLKLHFLKSLISFSSGNSEYEFPSLRELSILDCTKLKAFIRRLPALGVETMTEGSADFDESPQSLFDEKVLFPSLEQLTLMSLRGLTKIWHNELSEESFCKLASITVCDCENLSHIFPTTLIGRLQSLEMIEVVKCTSLEALVEHAAVNSQKWQDRLVSLEKLKLWDLPRLNALVLIGTEATLSLPSLTNVSLHRCHSLKYLIMNDTSVTLDKLEMLDISGCNNMKEVVVTQERTDRNSKAMKFPHLRTLKLHFLKSLISFSSGSSAHEFSSLKELSILDCTKFKTFIQRLPTLGVEMMTAGLTGFDESPRFLFDEKVVFPKLEELRLIGIQSRGFWENEMPNESFCQLKVLEVKQCPNLLNAIPSFVWKRLLHCMQSLTVVSCPCLRNLFTMSTAKNLVQLQHLVLDGCEEMEYIVAAEEEKPEEAADINVISKLVTLRLRKMIKLKSFYQGEHTSEWPSLKELTVEDCKAVEAIIGDASCRRLEGSVPTCQPLLLVEKGEFPNMESMKISHMDNMEQIWLGELTTNAFAKLKTLGVEYCEKLSFIFSSHTILTRFQNLEEVTVTDCGSLEVIFHGEESNHNEARPTSIFELKELKWERLPKMKHVWSGRLCGTLAFECLRCLKVKRCESLKSLFPVSIAKNMTQLENLLVRDCGVEEIITEEDGVGLSVGDHFFPQLTDLRLLELPKLRSFYKSSHTTTWLHLKLLRVRHCGKMRAFSFACEFQSGQDTIINENRPALFSFEKVSSVLEGATLTREDIVMLQQQHQRDVFGHLTSLVLACFHDEDDVFPSDFLQNFPNLETLNVICSSFVEIFPEDASGYGAAVVPCGGLTDMQKPLKELANLKELWLQKLCNLRRVWKEGSLMAELLNQIEYMFIVECPSLLTVLPSLTSFQRLRQLEVENCEGLVQMGTCSAMTSLVHLTWLTLRNCAAMEDVVTDDENGAEEITFPKMEELILDGLPRLQSFSPTDCTFSFPSLQRVVIKECPKMNLFCKGSLRTPNLTKVLLSEDDDEGPWGGDLNATVQTLYA